MIENTTKLTWTKGNVAIEPPASAETECFRMVLECQPYENELIFELRVYDKITPEITDGEGAEPKLIGRSGNTEAWHWIERVLPRSEWPAEIWAGPRYEGEGKRAATDPVLLEAIAETKEYFAPYFEEDILDPSGNWDDRFDGSEV